MASSFLLKYLNKCNKSAVGTAFPIMMTYHSMDLSENFHLYAHQSSLKTGLPTEMLTVLSKSKKAK